MQLLCDVCKNAVASSICCADEAALCSTCDSRVHAANKLASKHQRVPLLSKASEPVVCDICQELPSFFFCIEDRALLCRDCDVSIHSANAFAARHRRLLLTGLQVGTCFSSSPSRETTSAISLEKRMLDTSVRSGTPLAVKKQVVTTTSMSCGNNPGALGKLGETSKRALKTPPKHVVTTMTGNCSEEQGGILRKEVPEKTNSASHPVDMNLKALHSCLMSKQPTASSNYGTEQGRESTNKTSSNSTTISIQRISAGKVPFVAPVLGTLRAAIMQQDASNNVNSHNTAAIDSIKGEINNNIDNSSNNNVMMDMDDCPPVQGGHVSDYLVSGISGWRLDELLTELVGVCGSGSSLSPTKESDAPGFGIQEDPPWYAELDVVEEHDFSPSQEEGVALVPEIPSPPTASGLVTSHGKLTCAAAEQWDFEYLFNDPHRSNEFSVVPDIDCRRSSPLSTGLPTRGSISKKRKSWLEV